MKDKIFILLALIALLVLTIAGLWLGQTRDQYASVTSLSRGPSGLSAFREFAAQLLSGSVGDRRSAILDEEQLAHSDAYLLLSPRFEVTARESKFLRTFVENGGLLVLSFHSEETWRALQTLLKELGMSAAVQALAGFKNFEALMVTAPHDTKFFRPGKTYAFYSSKILAESGCLDIDAAKGPVPLSCFVKEEAIGSGYVTLIAGLPPLANALLGLGDNQDVAITLLDRAMRITIDEYRHYFSEKTFGDLVSEPYFSLPLLALMCAAIAFLLFGDSEPADVRDRRGKREVVVNYHEFSLNMLRGILGARHGAHAVLAQQSEFLSREFPARQAEINLIAGDTTIDILTRGARLVSLHRNEVERRRGLKGE